MTGAASTETSVVQAYLSRLTCSEARLLTWHHFFSERDSRGGRRNNDLGYGKFAFDVSLKSRIQGAERRVYDCGVGGSRLICLDKEAK